VAGRATLKRHISAPRIPTADVDVPGETRTGSVFVGPVPSPEFSAWDCPPFDNLRACLARGFVGGERSLGRIQPSRST
jgi:hypothetical protein